MKRTLSASLINRGLISSRRQAESYIKLGLVRVDNKVVHQSTALVDEHSHITLDLDQQYVSRAALKLASVAEPLKIDFHSKVVLDVGSSTGGFTDYALKHGAKKVIAVELGTNQLHGSLKNDSRIELHEKTDIRDIEVLSEVVDMVVIDVSFISLRLILPKAYSLSNNNVQILALFKPQFEVDGSSKNRGIVKNNKIRRELLKDFDGWLKQNHFVTLGRADSKIAGSMGNEERFYLLKKEKLAY